MTTGAAGKGVVVATVGDEASCARLAEALRRGAIAVVHRAASVEELPDGVDAVVLALGELGPRHVEALRALRARRPGTTATRHLSSAFTELGLRSRAAAASLILDPRAGFGTGILSITDDAAGRPHPASAPSA